MFGSLVHFAGPDLELHLLGLGADNRGVQGLVEIELGHGHVVLEPTLHWLPGGVDSAQGAVAVAHVVDDHPDADQVVDLVEGPALDDHLLVDAPQVLGAAMDVAGDSDFGQQALHFGDDLGEVEVPLRSPVLDHLGDLAVPLRVEGGQGQVLQLHLDLLHPQPVG